MSREEIEKCPYCKGKGKIERRKWCGCNDEEWTEKCEDCKGTGTMVYEVYDANDLRRNLVTLVKDVLEETKVFEYSSSYYMMHSYNYKELKKLITKIDKEEKLFPTE